MNWKYQVTCSKWNGIFAGTNRYIFLVETFVPLTFDLR